MKFIFPQNYNFNFKIFGFLDYKTIVFNFIYFFIIFIFTNIFSDLLFKIIFLIIFYLPILLISLFGFNQENIIYVFEYLFLFFKRPKYYLYKK